MRQWVGARTESEKNISELFSSTFYCLFVDYLPSSETKDVYSSETDGCIDGELIHEQYPM